MTVLSDLRHAARSLARAPAFATIVILTLGLGIGACTAIFTVVHAVLLEGLPFADARRLVALFELSDEGDRMSVPEANFLSWQEGAHSFTSLAMYGVGAVSLTGNGEPVRASVAFVSAPFFDVLGVAPLHGRTFLPEEARRGAQPVAVVSHAFWRDVLGGEPNLARVAVAVGGRPVPVVGVMPPSFDFPSGAQAWTPMETLGPVNPSRSAHNWRVVARLQPGVSSAAASRELGAIARRIHDRYADVTAVDAVAVPLQQALTQNVQQPLFVLSAAVGILLLVGCFNVVNLLLARATGRRHEGALRAALGAGRWRLAWPFLAESLLLGLAGGGLGILAAYWGVDALLALDPGNLPRLAEVTIDPAVLGFSVALSLLTALAVGLVPGIRSGLVDPRSALQESARGAAGSRSQARLRHLLVSVQVGLTVVLLVGAALLGRSFLGLLSVDLGFRTADRLVVTISSPPASDEEATRRRVDVHRRIEERLAALPGVAASGGVNGLPMSGSGANGRFLIEGGGDSGDFWPEYRVASPGYFAAAGIPLLRGRLFDASDDVGTPQVALVSQRVAERIWPAGDAIGARINTGNMDGDESFMTVVGVVGDVRQRGPASPYGGTVYVHYLQRPAATESFMVILHSDGAPRALIPAVRAAVRAVDPELPLRFQTMDELYRHALADRRFALTLVGAFGTAALALALLGVYGAVSYAVARRVPEIGIRLALGARSEDVVRLFLLEGARGIVLGAVGGLLAAGGASRLLASLLFGVRPSDASSYATAAVVTVGVALVACLVPARRGSRVDPAATLRRR